MVGVAQDVTALERELNSITIERDRLRGEKAHLETVNGIQTETITLLQSERDRYFKSSQRIGALCEFLADGLTSGIRQWKEAEPNRSKPEEPATRLITTAADASAKLRQSTASISEALSKLNDAAGVPPHRSADRLPRVEPARGANDHNN